MNLKMRYLWVLLALFSSTIAHGEAGKGSSGGRFQVVQLSSMRRDQVLIDTQTGKMWHYICLNSAPTGDASDCAYSAWMADDIEGISKSKAAIYKDSAEIKKLTDGEQTK